MSKVIEKTEYYDINRLIESYKKSSRKSKKISIQSYVKPQQKTFQNNATPPESGTLSPNDTMQHFLASLGVDKIYYEYEILREKRKEEYAIQLKELDKIYGKGETTIHALRSVDLAIKQGEIVTVMGPSGSGKSTLLNILGAMDYPTSGHVIVDGLDITKLEEKKLARFRRFSIGYIFQDFYLLPHLDVLENVLVPKIPYGIEEKDRVRAKELLEIVGLGDRLHQNVEKLSGGQKQRVAIARALINNPNVIFADEPTGNLDSETGREIIDLLLSLAEKGKTIVIVTHDPRIGQLVKDHPKGRNIWMLDGKISDKPSVNSACWN